MLSPYCAGSALTRKSTILPPILSLMRPSCGMRRSDRSMFDNSLRREMIDACARFGGGGIRCSTPSIRYRIFTSYFPGST